jgi:hypothetical protein
MVSLDAISCAPRAAAALRLRLRHARLPTSCSTPEAADAKMSPEPTNGFRHQGDVDE